MTQHCPTDAPIREAIRANVQTLCSECKYVLDLCNDVDMTVTKVNGYNAVAQCVKYQLNIDEP